MSQSLSSYDDIDTLKNIWNKVNSGADITISLYILSCVVFLHTGSWQWFGGHNHSKKHYHGKKVLGWIPGLNWGPFCAEFSGSTQICVGFLQVLTHPNPHSTKTCMISPIGNSILLLAVSVNEWCVCPVMQRWPAQDIISAFALCELQ